MAAGPDLGQDLGRHPRITGDQQSARGLRVGQEMPHPVRQVRRQLDSSKPQAALKATVAPAPPAPKSAGSILDTGTYPMKPVAEKPSSPEDAAGALSLAKTFDSFDATLRLASMTNQADEFRDYISNTQKMRAYRGKIEADSPLAKDSPQPAPAPPPQEPPQISIKNPDFPIRPRQAIPTNPPVPPPEPSRFAHNLPAIVAIVVLAVAAVALATALIMK